MRHLRKLLVPASLVTVLLAGAACGSNSAAPSSSKTGSFNLVTPGTLTIANFGTEYPDVVVKGNTISGIDGDYLNAFANKYGLKIKLFTTSFPSTILAVQQHKADVAVNFYWSAARGAQVKYSVPYTADYSVVITNKDQVKYTGPASLNGKKIGVIVGTVYTPVVQASFPANEITVYPGIAEAGQALINGQIDAMIESSSTYSAPPLSGAKNVAKYPITAGQFGITADNVSFPDSNITQCTNDGLNNAFNAELKSLQASGEWDKILKKYGAKTPATVYKAPVGGCNG